MRYSVEDNTTKAYELLKRAREGSVIGVVYRGLVVNNNDPSGTGRIKVWVPSLYPSLEPYNTETQEYNQEDIEIIPWALPSFQSASYNAGSFIVPQLGDTAWVLFENNDIFRPVYIGFMYTSSTDMATPIGSGVAPANTNYAPAESIKPNHYVVMKTPKGSGLWMNDEDQTAHFNSANGGSIDFLEDRAVLAYSTGGTISSQDKGILLLSPEEGKILITDEEEPMILLERGEAKVTLIQDKKIEIKIGDKLVSVDQDEDLVKVHYNDSVSVNLGDDSILVKIPGAMIELGGDNINIKASGSINIDAPSVNITGED